MLRTAVPLAILAGCQVLTFLTGGIDLSVGSVASMSGFLVATLVGDYGLVVALLIALGIAAVAGRLAARDGPDRWRYPCRAPLARVGIALGDRAAQPPGVRAAGGPDPRRAAPNGLRGGSSSPSGTTPWRPASPARARGRS